MKSIYCIEPLKLLLFFLSFIIKGDDISFLKQVKNNQISSDKLFWHLDHLKQNQFTGKNVLIVTIDESGSYNNSNCNLNSEIKSNIDFGASFSTDQAISQKNKNHPSELMKKEEVSSILVKKNHELCTIEVIRQLAPEASIISIPISHSFKNLEKENIYQALKKAKTYNPDILHLSFQILDFDQSKKLDKKISRILSNFNLVIVPAGNNIFYNNFPPKLPWVFSVASFGKKGDRFPVSNFCINNHKADLLMPGEEIWIKVWIPECNSYEYIPLYGTSFSTALMTGLAACLLEKNNKNRKKVIAHLEKNAVIFDHSWKDRSRYGFPSF